MNTKHRNRRAARCGCILRCVLTAAALALAGCGEKAPSPPPPKAAGDSVDLPNASLKFIEIQSVGDGLVAGVNRLPGRLAVRPEAVVSLGAPVAGRVATLSIRPGDLVAPGKVLLTIQSADASAARTTLAQANVRVQAAEEALRRQTEMVAKGVGLEFERFEAETRVKEARAELDRARRAANLLGSGDGETISLRAPVGGVVMALKSAVGAMVAPGGESIVEIGDPSRLSVVADVGEAEAGAVRRGQPVKISIGLIGQQVDGVIEGIGPGVDATTRRMPIFVALKSVPARSAPGMQVEIELQDTDAVLSLPATAVLIKDGHRRVVYVEKSPGKFEPRDIRTGRATDGRIQVHEGLKAGDRVVVKGALLIDGQADQAL